MGRWVTYFKERFPASTYLVLSFGMAAQATVIANDSLKPQLLFLGTIINILFFAVLRLMDEVKDVAKDRIAHPERPLARGLVGVGEARLGIGLGILMMTISALGLGFFKGPMPGILYATTTVYLWLMYKEFYLGAWLSRKPLFYALSHQLILVPLVATVAALEPKMDYLVWEWGLVLIGGLQILPAFFMYEVARKLDPSSHPVLGAYRTVYGLRKCQLILGSLAVVSVFMMVLAFKCRPFSSFSPYVIAPFILCSIFSPLFVYVLKGDSSAKITEGLATINLIVAMYAPVASYCLIRFF